MLRLLAATLLAIPTASQAADRDDEPTAKSPRLILFSLGDDFGFNNVGYPHGPDLYANPEMRTPNLDRLAMGGVRLERHCKYCASRIRISRRTSCALRCCIPDLVYMGILPLPIVSCGAPR